MSLRSNIWKFYFVKIFLRSLVFPILVVYFLASGLTGTQIGLIFSIGVFTSFILELPSGYISDKIGHKYAIIATFLLKAVGMLVYLGGSFWWFVGAEILFLAGGAMWSGTGQAFLYETLNDLKRVGDYEKILGRSMAVALPAGAGFLIIMPFIYAYNNQLVFYLNSALLLVAMFVALTLKQPSFGKSVGKAEGWLGVIIEWREIWRFIIRNKRYRALVLFFSFWQAVQDAIDSVSQLFFVFLGIPTKLYGIIYAANRILQGLGGELSHRLKKIMNSLQIMAFFGIELVLFFVFGGYVNRFFGFLLFPARNFLEGLSLPLRSGLVNSEITEGNRVTLLSVSPMLRRLFQTVIVFVLGVLFDMFSVPQVFLITAAGTALILIILYTIASNSFRKNTY